MATAVITRTREWSNTATATTAPQSDDHPAPTAPLADEPPTNTPAANSPTLKPRTARGQAVETIEVSSVASQDGSHRRSTPGTPAPKENKNAKTASQRRSIRRSLEAWLVALLGTALFILTIIYAASTTALLRSSLTTKSSFNTILVLTVLSELSKLGLTGALDGALERLQWRLLSRPEGLAFRDYLALDQGTSKLGLFTLLFSKRKAGHVFSVLRLTAIGAISVLSIILLSNVNGDVDYALEASFPIAAGIGDFNASWIKNNEDIVAMLFQTDVSGFLTDPKRSYGVDPVVQGPSICSADDPRVGSDACKASYFVPGGLDLITPWPSRNTTLLDKPVYTVQDLQGLQLDFSAPEPGDNSAWDRAKDCIVPGSDSWAVQLCVTKPSDNVIYGRSSSFSSLHSHAFHNNPMPLKQKSSAARSPTKAAA